MAKDHNQKKESPLVVVAISEGETTTLITPGAEYTLFQNRLLKIEGVGDYKKRVDQKLSELSKRVGIGAGVYKDKDVLIQFKYGTKPIGLS